MIYFLPRNLPTQFFHLKQIFQFKTKFSIFDIFGGIFFLEIRKMQSVLRRASHAGSWYSSSGKFEFNFNFIIIKIILSK